MDVFSTRWSDQAPAAHTPVRRPRPIRPAAALFRKDRPQHAGKLARSDEIDRKIEETGIEELSYANYGAYRLSLEKNDIAKHREFFKTTHAGCISNSDNVIGSRRRRVRR